MSTRLIDKGLPIGFVLADNFRVEGLLGQGGFGTTYLATDIQLDCPVAIKEYNPSFAIRRSDYTITPVTESNRENYSWGFERFLKEAQLLAKFHHPNIVRVRHIFRANETAYIVMDYERGVSLLEKLDTDGLFTTDSDVLDVLIPIVDGLNSVHKREFLHRDIKPHNLFIRNDGSPLLLDFGSARVQGIDATRTVHPGYTPIEQFEEGNHEGAFTDIYSLGAAMYHAIKGRAPPSALTRQTEIIMCDRDPYIPLSRDDLTGEFAADLVDSLNASLIQDPTRRPQSLDDWQLPFEAALVTTRKTFTARPSTTQTTESADRAAPQYLGRRIAIGACVVAGCFAAYLAMQSFSIRQQPADSITAGANNFVAEPLAANTVSPPTELSSHEPNPDLQETPELPPSVSVDAETLPLELAATDPADETVIDIADNASGLPTLPHTGSAQIALQSPPDSNFNSDDLEESDSLETAVQAANAASELPLDIPDFPSVSTTENQQSESLARQIATPDADLTAKSTANAPQVPANDTIAKTPAQPVEDILREESNGDHPDSFSTDPLLDTPQEIADSTDDTPDPNSITSETILSLPPELKTDKASISANSFSVLEEKTTAPLEAPIAPQWRLPKNPPDGLAPIEGDAVNNEDTPLIRTELTVLRAEDVARMKKVEEFKTGLSEDRRLHRGRGRDIQLADGLAMLEQLNDKVDAAWLEEQYHSLLTEMLTAPGYTIATNPSGTGTALDVVRSAADSGLGGGFIGDASQAIAKTYERLVRYSARAGTRQRNLKNWQGVTHSLRQLLDNKSDTTTDPLSSDQQTISNYYRQYAGERSVDTTQYLADWHAYLSTLDPDNHEWLQTAWQQYTSLESSAPACTNSVNYVFSYKKTAGFGNKLATYRFPSTHSSRLRQLVGELNEFCTVECIDVWGKSKRIRKDIIEQLTDRGIKPRHIRQMSEGISLPYASVQIYATDSHCNI